MPTPYIRIIPLALALAACATPVPRFDPLPDTQRLPVEYRADAVAGAWSPEGAQPTDAASTQEELAVTEQVMVECRVLTLPDDLVESLKTLQRTLEAAEAWTAEERDDLGRLLEHSRAVYEKRIDEARAHCEDLRKLRADKLAEFSRLYDAMYIILTKKPGFADFNTQANRCASDAPQQKPRQETQQLGELYEAGAVSARAPFTSLLDAAQQRSPALKSRWRR